jgi:hypothetical protein
VAVQVPDNLPNISHAKLPATYEAARASLEKCSSIDECRRWADKAAEPVELLAVNERFLERIQFRYPRIASKAFLNLTRIVSDRLQGMTEQYVAGQTSRPPRPEIPCAT